MTSKPTLSTKILQGLKVRDVCLLTVFHVIGPHTLSVIALLNFISSMMTRSMMMKLSMTTASCLPIYLLKCLPAMKMSLTLTCTRKYDFMIIVVILLPDVYTCQLAVG